MELYEIINLLASIILCFSIFRQFQIVATIDWKNLNRIEILKILFPAFNIFILFAMWLPYMNNILWSSVCFLFASVIAFYTYWSSTFKINKKCQKLKNKR